MQVFSYKKLEQHDAITIIDSINKKYGSKKTRFRNKDIPIECLRKHISAKPLL